MGTILTEGNRVTGSKMLPRNEDGMTVPLKPQEVENSGSNPIPKIEDGVKGPLKTQEVEMKSNHQEQSNSKKWKG